MSDGKFTYPFSYVPTAEVKAAAQEFLQLHSGERRLDSKMIGVLVTDRETLFAFSGTLDGVGDVPGFVPMIFDWTRPGGYFRRREAEISAMPDGPAKSLASARLQDWLFGQYEVLNARGGRRSIKDIFADRAMVPPGGTGDCAAPKLLQEAYLKGLKPKSMGEFWFGTPSSSEVREQGRFYPACMGKCGPLLTYMMQGLDVEPNPLDASYPIAGKPRIVYEDSDIIVADKPSGMLSVPGRGTRDSLLEWLRRIYGEVHSCHRLDMDTSGLMVFARTLDCKRAMEAAFASHEVRKSYRARLCGGPKWSRSASGTIALPLAADYYDRPRQVVDFENGKKAVTRYEVLQMFPDGEIEIRFEPYTGRTHQLRVHAAHALGLGRPIKGDRLYGSPSAGRLFLHAETLEFLHPSNGTPLSFRSDISFPLL